MSYESEQERWNLTAEQVDDMSVEHLIKQAMRHIPDVFDEMVEDLRLSLTEELFEQGKENGSCEAIDDEV